MNVFDALARGYFPRELPPSFSTHDFATVAGSLTAAQPSQTWTAPATLNLARPGSLRRRLTIPNPFGQLRLVEECVAHWPALSAHVSQSKLSLSTPLVDTTGARALRTKSAFWEQVPERAARMNRSRFVFTSDISEFYASIYTHSVEWGLFGKPAVKAMMSSKPRPQTSGLLLDRAVQACNEGQTKGVPISPDTSLLLSEIVLTAVDLELQARFPGLERSCFRFIDDLGFFAPTLGAAEDVLLAWQSSLSAYGLMVNPRKTEIREGPKELEAEWRTRLAQFQIRVATDQQAANDIYSYFSTVFTHAQDHKNDAVVSYAVSRMRSAIQGPESWAAAQQMMLAGVSADPSCLPFVARVVMEAVKKGAAVDLQRFEETLNDLASYHARREHGSEVAWALWLLREFKLPLWAGVAGEVSSMEDNSSLLLLFDIDSLGLVQGGSPDLSAAILRAESADVWKSDDWLLGYECARNSWASDAEFRVQPHWDELLNLGVRFLLRSPSASVSGKTPSTAVGAAPSGTAPGLHRTPAHGQVAIDETTADEAGPDEDEVPTPERRPDEAPTDTASASTPLSDGRTGGASPTEQKDEGDEDEEDEEDEDAIDEWLRLFVLRLRRYE